MIPCEPLPEMLTEQAMVANVGVSFFGFFVSSIGMIDQPSQYRFKLLGIVVQFSAFGKPRVFVDCFAHYASHPFRRTLQELDIALVQVEWGGLEGQQSDATRAQPLSIFVVFKEWSKHFLARESIEKVPITYYAEMDFGMICDNSMESWHDWLPVAFPVLCSIEDCNFVARLFVFPWRQVGDLVLEHHDVWVPLTDRLGHLLGADLDSVNSPELDIVVLGVALKANRVIVELGDQETRFNVFGLLNKVQVAESLLNDDLGRIGGCSDSLTGRTLHTWNRAQCLEWLMNPRPGAARFGDDGVDVDVLDLGWWLDGSYQVLKRGCLPQIDVKRGHELAPHLPAISVCGRSDAADLVDLKASLVKHLADTLEGKPPQVRTVHDAFISVLEVAEEQAVEHAEVLNVGDRGEDLGAGMNIETEFFQYVPRIFEVFKDVAKDQAIGQSVIIITSHPSPIFDCCIHDINTMTFSDFACFLVWFNSQPFHFWIDSLISFRQRPGPAADLEDKFDIRRNELEQVMVNPTVVIRFHRIPPLRVKTDVTLNTGARLAVRRRSHHTKNVA